MFELNKVQRTKSGEMLKPFTVQGEMVLCADRDGNTIKVPLSEFDFSIPVEKEILEVQPAKKSVLIDEEKNEDSLFTEDEYDEEVFELANMYLEAIEVAKESVYNITP